MGQACATARASAIGVLAAVWRGGVRAVAPPDGLGERASHDDPLAWYAICLTPGLIVPPPVALPQSR